MDTIIIKSRHKFSFRERILILLGLGVEWVAEVDVEHRYANVKGSPRTKYKIIKSVEI